MKNRMHLLSAPVHVSTDLRCTETVTLDHVHTWQTKALPLTVTNVTTNSKVSKSLHMLGHACSCAEYLKHWNRYQASLTEVKRAAHMLAQQWTKLHTDVKSFVLILRMALQTAPVWLKQRLRDFQTTVRMSILYSFMCLSLETIISQCLHYRGCVSHCEVRTARLAHKYSCPNISQI